MAAIGMPPHILALFQARPPLDPFPAFKKKHTRGYVGLADYVNKFESGPPPPTVPYETPKQRLLRQKRARLLSHLSKQKELIKQYNPKEDKKLTGDPFRTLFVGGISYDTTEKKLRREFEQYGSIKRVRLIYDRNGKPRGYGFIEFENDRDMKEAYKNADGKKIDGRRVLVDVERARTVPGWLPRRLGGGRGKPRGSNTKPKKPPMTAGHLQLSLLPPLPTPPDPATLMEKKRRDEERRRERERERERGRSRSRERKDRKRSPGRDRSRSRERRR
ncbi:UNVERIFIED_CONTAM: RNA recognition motif-containing protein [Hammondia hammondi]|eukprot:XP_008887446.1 RNA recognition motif-containing protein [Hammondia hammondi]